MLHKNIKGKKLILASGSPRRQQFLKDLGLDFEIRLKEIDEFYPPSLKKEEITDYLALLKAEAFTDDLSSDEILITSDTIVWLEDEAIGKPESEKDAEEMLERLSGKVHEVITSIAITDKHHQIIVHDTTRVHFKELTADEISYYVKTFKPMDKAGSYGIQEWIGFIGIDRIEGSYFNVMGFPTHKFYKALSEF